MNEDRLHLTATVGVLINNGGNETGTYKEW